PQDLSHPAFEDMYDDPCLHSEIIEHEGVDQACNAITPKADEAISIKIKKLKEEIKQKKKNQREKRRALKEQNMKVDIKEMEQHSKQDALHVLLATHLQLLCSLNMIEEGRQVLQYYRHKSKIGVNHLKVTDVKVHNILMHGYAALGQFENTKELLSFMAEGEIKPNAQTYAAVFECVERSNIGDKVTILKFYQKQLEERGLTLNDLFDKTEFLRDQRQVVLNAVRRLDPVFQPQYTPIPLDYDCPLMGRLHLDAVLERQGLLCSPAEGIISVEDMVQRGKEQLKIEMKGDVEMQNIDIKDEATSPLVQFCRQKLKEAETEWRSVIREAFLRNLSALKSQSKASHSAITLFPYLNSLNVEQFVELIMSEISKLVDGSETYSPTLKNLQRALGTQVYYKYQVEQYKSNGIIKKIEEIYEKYCEWYITRHSVDGSGVPYNPRQAWQALVNRYRDGASLDIAETQWPLEIRQNVGKFLYNIIINDVKIDVNMFKTKAKQKMLPAVYKVHRPLGRLVRMELKPHPVLARAWASACPPRLRMRAALLPTIAPPAPWSAPHPVAHLTPPAPLIRCVRTWAGRARRAAAHHRAARALVRAAHQVRTYVGRTCPPRCCPPPRRPRPGPRRTPSRTSPRPRRSSGAYVRGPDVPAALLPTTAPPAPWSAPHPVAHLTPPAPLIRCVRTWAGRARRAAAHHRAARALVRAAPRRAPHPARAAHQVRTYVGRTCPPRCCPPPRRPRPGPRRTPSRTSPRPRRSSGAYVRGPDVPAALLPTTAPPAPWSAPLIRCVRTWAGRARRAAAHHRAARALVRAAPRRAPHPARAAHQVRTYVGRTCPPRCCPPPRRPRPGPRRTPSRTSPRPRRSSGAYVRGPDVPAALLPTTAPPAPWSAPHPVAHLTPPAPLIRCVRTWAGRARRAAAHHRAARALVRAAHQVRTYVGRTCPPRCCPPPRRPRPGPRRTPSRTSPRPRRSSGAYVRGPDVPAALLPTTAPPAPWSAPHPVAHLTPPAPLIRCVRTWAGRARRAAAHHRAARALVRAAPRRAPHPARATHQVRTYVGRTCPPRCCPPPRRPRPGPRRSSGAYVRGPDVPAALLPTTAPPAPWSAPLIRCVRTWAGRARRAAAHHRAARALVRAAPRRAPHPARAAHQVRTYVGRTCPPRCCPPPRRPRPGPRRTPSRTSPRPRRSSGAYVRGPDVPAALLPTTAPPAPWSAPHPVAHLTPPAPLIRCVRTWAGRARRAAAHHRAARALVRAAHQVRTYVGRTCPPRCCPPPRRPRPGPRRTPSRTSPRPRRSSGAYVRGPDVPAALLPTTAPPAPWSAPHPVAHLTPPAPLIRCVRTWAGRARRAAAHHRAARALVRAAPRRAPHPARAAHQVRTYVGRTCPPRCCPPPRRPRPGPRRSSGAYVRGPDVPAALLPTTAPPAPWSAPLIRLAYHVNTQMKRIADAPPTTMYPVYDSLNQLGEVPWVINKPILDLQLKIFRSGGNKKLDIPPPSSALDTSQYGAATEPAAVFKRRVAISRARADMHSLWCDALYKLSLANHFRDKVFWLPHNMDFRGRVYACPPHLSALGADPARALLHFARKRPLGPAGLAWLQLHAINLTGEFKRHTVADRLKHAEKIMDLILDSADRPLDGKGWWKKSEEPWQTLACCMEIANAVRSPNPEEYMCGFPVHQDGSCNGLQHYAALGGDAAGAAAVNLAPARRPQDVYSAVVALVEEMRARDAANGVPAAIILENFVRRKVIKQTVMTTVYGVTKFGARLQIAKQLKDIDDFPKEHVWTCSQYLTMKTFDSLQEMFTSTKLIQDWFTECAKLVSGVCGESVEWVTPLGLPVVQPYYRRVASASNKLPLDQQQRPCTMKQRNAFPPNFIHSLDSSHMMQTGLRCQAAGLTFVSVHDCFWTHPADVPRMNQICREEFVALHSQPILEDLSKFLVKRYSYPESEVDDDSMGSANKRRVNNLLQKVPKKGNFDLKSVIDSIYFFS
ncbi:hypothetical protein ACJJTC_010329, partial [Scirpophaga incertulas]